MLLVLMILPGIQRVCLWANRKSHELEDRCLALAVTRHAICSTVTSTELGGDVYRLHFMTSAQRIDDSHYLFCLLPADVSNMQVSLVIPEQKAL